MHLLQSENSPFTEGKHTVYTYFVTEKINFVTEKIQFVTEYFCFVTDMSAYSEYSKILCSDFDFYGI